MEDVAGHTYVRAWVLGCWGFGLGFESETATDGRFEIIHGEESELWCSQ